MCEIFWLHESVHPRNSSETNACNPFFNFHALHTVCCCSCCCCEPRKELTAREDGLGTRLTYIPMEQLAPCIKYLWSCRTDYRIAVYIGGFFTWRFGDSSLIPPLITKFNARQHRTYCTVSTLANMECNCQLKFSAVSKLSPNKSITNNNRYTVVWEPFFHPLHSANAGKNMDRRAEELASLSFVYPHHANSTIFDLLKNY